MNEQRTPIVSFIATCALAAAIAGGFVGCGGAEAPPPPPPSVAAPTAAPTATAQADAEPPKPRIRVDLLEAKMSPPLDKPLIVQLQAPGADQFVPAHYAQSYRVRFAVAGATLPEGAHLQLVFDNVPFRPITDLKEKLTLADLAGEGKEIAEGEHILAAYVVLPNREAIRSERGVSVSRFWIGKRTGDTFKSRDPLLVLGSPSGTYEGETAQEIVADYYVLDAPMSDKEYTVRLVLKGPGADGEGIARLMNEWKPALVWSAGDGEYSLEATLLDPQGQPVESPWNPAVRTFTVRPKK